MDGKRGTLIPPSLERSRNMAAIRSRDTKPELQVRRAIHAAGFRFRLHDRELAGRPDLVFRKYMIAVFVHGCFWHGHECREARRPQSNLAYWAPKIDGNMRRDQRNATRLRREGWSVVVIRECSVNRDVARLLRKLAAAKLTA